ncbi:MAG: putative metalloprotease CJM1_0395 family protein [Nitrospinaceae bacterium]
MGLSTEIQINPNPIARIIVRGSCTECEDEEKAKGETGQPPAANGQDRVELSAASRSPGAEEEAGEPGGAESGTGATDSTGRPLSEEEARQVQQLRTRDREVRAHEQAHKGAAGPYARGAATFEYETGPDGKRYAVGGEVSIDTSPVPDNPQATLRKAQTLRRAALAPQEPSSQDRRVAAQAAAMETKARREIQEQGEEDAANPAAAGSPGSNPLDARPAAATGQGSAKGSGPPIDRRIQAFSQGDAKSSAGSLINLTA